MLHYPVMLTNILKQLGSLQVSRRISLVDCNFGLGGHSNAILRAFPNIHITAYDLDREIIDKYRSSQQLQTGDQSRLEIVLGNYTGVLGTGRKYEVLLADLGFNSVQLEQREGFSWNRDTPLVMVYDKKMRPCSELINEFSFVDLVDILVKYGDLGTSEARLAAKKIQESRPLTTTYQLRDCIVGCFQNSKTKKIAQVFQAFRVAANREIESLRALCEGMDKILAPNALVMMLTFHSLQRDAIVRSVKANHRLYSKIRFESPSLQQIGENCRSKSAQLLTFRRL